jgi:type II secretory pathway component PulK
MIGHSPRRGSALVIGMVALVVLAMIEGVLLQRGLAHRRQLVAVERRLQAEWLGQAGLDRAAAALAKDPSYKGEIWEVPSEELNGRDAARVRLVVQPDTARGGRRRVRIEVDDPREEPVRARWKGEQLIDAGPRADGGQQP